MTPAIIPIWVYPTMALSIATVSFAGGIGASRVFYKAGQVDALEQKIEAMEELDHRKDALLDQWGRIDETYQGIVTELSGTLSKMAADKPTHTREVIKEAANAPDTYRDQDPNQCLSYVYPLLMRDNIGTSIRNHAAGLPKFDQSGRRVSPTAGGEEPG